MAKIDNPDALEAISLIEMADELRMISDLEPRYQWPKAFANDIESRAKLLLEKAVRSELD